MKAKITAKSELRWPQLIRDYTFDILDDGDDIILGSQSVQARPSEIVSCIQQIVSEYQTAYESELDVEIGDEI